MATVQSLRDAYDGYSKTASDLTRKLAFAGVAAVWVFVDASDSAETGLSETPSLLLLAGVFFAAALGFDLLHYALSAAVYGFLHRRAERNRLAPGDAFDINPRSNWPGLLFYVLKQVACVVGYGVLIVSLIRMALA